MSRIRGKWVIIIAIAAVAVAALGLGLFTYFTSNRLFTGYNVDQEWKRTDSNAAKYCLYKGDILKYSRDGISTFTIGGDTLWNGGYEMERPQLDVCGDYAVVADVGFKQFYIYNGKDSGTRVETTLPIVKARATSNGLVAVLLEDKDSNVLNIYNPYSSATPIVVEVPTNVDGDGYTVDFDVSPDGSSLAAAYLTVTDGAASNKLVFYNFSEVGQDKNRLVGGTSMGKTMISHIEFIDEDKVAVFYENGFSIWKSMKQPTESVKKTYKDDIKSVLLDEKHIGVILTKENAKEYFLHLYDFGGSETLSTTVKESYDNAELYDDEIIFTSIKTCNILRTNGKDKFHFTFDRNIEEVLPATGGNHYYVVDANTIQKIKITN